MHVASQVERLNRLRETVALQQPASTVAAGTIAAVPENPDTACDIAAACTAGYLTAMGGVYAESASAQATRRRSRRSSPLTRVRARDVQPSRPPPNRYSTMYRWWDRAADIVTILLPPGLPRPTIEATLLAGAPW